MNSIKKVSYLFLLAGISLCLVFSASISDARGTKEKDIHQDTIKKQLESAITASPENYALYYYLGIISLRMGDRDGAVDAWNLYLASAPEDSRSISIREQLTILRMEQARESARNALKQESGGEEITEMAENTIAVLDFKNLGSSELVPFVKGLTAMIITDLAKVPQLKVVERARMQALMDEMKLAQTGVIDPDTTARMGRLLQARTIDWGELKALADDVISIRTVLSDTLSQTKIGEKVTAGHRRNFFELQKQLVFQILALLGIKEGDLGEDVLKALKTIHTRNYDAFMSYGKGLDFLDKKDFSRAKESFETASQLDPDFGMADAAETSTPATDVVVASYVETPPEETATPSDDGTTAGADDTDSETTAGADGTDSETTAGADSAGSETRTALDTDSGTIVTTETTEAAIDTTTDITQDTTQTDYYDEGDSHYDDPPYVEPRPTGGIGYFANLLRNKEATPASHGIYYTPAPLDFLGASEWFAYSTWGYPSEATGTGETIESLVVSSNTASTGLPNDVTYTEDAYTAYMVWGHWSDTDVMALDPLPTSPAGAGEYVFDAVGYYVYGDPTSAGQMTDLSSGMVSATYSGNAYATHTAEPDVTMTGSFSANVDFSADSIDTFNLSVSSTNHSAEIIGGRGDFGWETGAESHFELWAGAYFVDGAEASGMNDFGAGGGSFYGPGAENIGGIFIIEKDLGVNSVHGMFEGAQ